MTPAIVAFSGGIASGKSTLSRALAVKLGWPHVSFGHQVRRVAVERGLDPTSRAVLQDLGEQLLRDELGAFVATVLHGGYWQPGRPLVVDGLRHVEVADRLRSLVTPLEVLIVFVSTGRATREQRLLERIEAERGTDVAPLAACDRHPVEAQVSSVLRERADFVADGEVTEEVTLRQVIDWLTNREEGRKVGNHSTITQRVSSEEPLKVRARR